MNRIVVFLATTVAVLVSGCAGGDPGATPATTAGGTAATAVVNVAADDPLGPFRIDDDGVQLAPAGPAVHQDRGGCLQLQLTGATFESDRADLTPAGQRVISDLVSTLASPGQVCGTGDLACPAAEVSIMVDGHTDARSTNRPGGNDQLALDRAAAVAGVLRQNGFRAEAQGHGAAVPPTPPAGGWANQDEELAASRRVEITLRCPPR